MSGLIRSMFPNIHTFNLVTISVGGGVGILGIVVFLMGWWPLSPPNPPQKELMITEPAKEVVLTKSNGSWTFSAKGTAPEKHFQKYLYVFVQGSGAYYYSEVTDIHKDGGWQGRFYTGSVSANPRSEGQSLVLVAVVTAAPLAKDGGTAGFSSLNDVPHQLDRSLPKTVTVSKIVNPKLGNTDSPN